MRVSSVAAAAFAAAAVFSAPVAQAQAYPHKPIRMVVGFPSGGAPDTLARIVSEKISPAWGQPVVVDNKPGAAAISAPRPWPMRRPTAIRWRWAP